MAGLKNITAQVKEIMEKDKATRNSDNLLYLRVYEQRCKEICLHSFVLPLLLSPRRVRRPCTLARSVMSIVKVRPRPVKAGRGRKSARYALFLFFRITAPRSSARAQP